MQVKKNLHKIERPLIARGGGKALADADAKNAFFYVLPKKGNKRDKLDLANNTRRKKKRIVSPRFKRRKLFIGSKQCRNLIFYTS